MIRFTIMQSNAALSNVNLLHFYGRGASGPG
jgi:hypothetical protein